MGRSWHFLACFFLCGLDVRKDRLILFLDDCLILFLWRTGTNCSSTGQTEGGGSFLFLGTNPIFERLFPDRLFCVLFRTRAEEVMGQRGRGQNCPWTGTIKGGKQRECTFISSPGDKSDIRNEQKELSKSVPEGPIFRVCPRNWTEGDKPGDKRKPLLWLA